LPSALPATFAIVGELGATAVAEGRRRLQPALALAAQDGELVAVALLDGLLQLAEHHPQRADAIRLARLHGSDEILLDRVDQRHLPTSIERPQAFTVNAA